jgi:D-sedoheptulose 7-phosphate isomerase
MTIKDKDVQHQLDILLERYPALKECENDIISAYLLLEDCFKNGGKLLIAGNGGSAADSNHIVGELMKSFCKKRKIDKKLYDKISKNEKYGKELADSLQGALPTISLNNHESLNTAFLNDVNPCATFAQQIIGYGNSNDVFLGISTSGNSKNVVMASIVAKAKGMKVISLTGKKDSDLSNISDVTIKAPETETYKIQEYHLPIYHALCLMLEDEFFKE